MKRERESKLCFVLACHKAEMRARQEENLIWDLLHIPTFCFLPEQILKRVNIETTLALSCFGIYFVLIVFNHFLLVMGLALKTNKALFASTTLVTILHFLWLGISKQLC